MKILNKLTIKHLTLNKKRTITTILGICLSTALMVGIGLLFSTIREEAIKADISDKGEYIIKYVDVPSEKLEFVSKNKQIKDYYYISSLGLTELADSEEKSFKFIETTAVNKNFFKYVELLEGRLPENEEEVLIPKHLYYSDQVDTKLNKTITLEMENDGKTTTKTFKIVGVIEKTPYENYWGDTYQIYTLDENAKGNLTIYINVKNIKNTYKINSAISPKLEISIDNICINETMLSLHGVSKYSNITDSMAGIMAIVLGLIGIGCVIVIYNSFAISVMERKKQFGLFASIGTTRKQLRYTVFFEALIVGLIGIPLGILSAYLGIGCVILIVNNLLKDAFTIPLELTTYWLFIFVPVLFMILTITLSAFIPAKKAAKTSPISAIRQHDDIKIDPKKIKTNKLFLKIFGIEGDIALKNIKRNKKKYRITVLSLVVSIILFVSFSSLLEYGLKTSDELINVPAYNLVLRHSSINSGTDHLVKMQSVRKNSQIEGSLLVVDERIYDQNAIDKKYYTDEFLRINDKYEFRYDDTTEIYVYSDTDYEALKEKYHIKEDVPFLVNSYAYTSYADAKRKTFTGTKFKDIDNITITDYETKEEYVFSNLKLIDSEEYVIPMMSGICNTIIINSNMLKDINTKLKSESTPESVLTMKATKYDELEHQLEEIEKESIYFNYYNITEQTRLLRNIVLVVEILLYGFISLVTLIGVTSVFNTINTSMNLRRKEFATLRSIGLSPKGFNRMLYLESIFFGLKSLIFGLPISIGVSYLIFKSLQDTIEFAYIFPFKPVIIATISVFIIVISNMMYSTHKIKKENILEAIREENI